MLAGKGLEVVENRDGVVVIRRADRSIVQPTGGEPREEIVVTGSRIERAGFDTLQPATVHDAAQIEKRGYVNVAEALDPKSVVEGKRVLVRVARVGRRIIKKKKK